MGSDPPFDDIDREIELQVQRLEACRKAILLSRTAIWTGAAVLAVVLTFAQHYRTPAIVFGAITAVLGGTVWFGANKSSREEAEARLADAEAQKSRLFDEVAARNGWRDLTPSVH